MSEIDELTSQIRALFGDNPESNPLFKEMAKKLAAADSEKPKRVIAKKQPPVTIYTEVTIHYHCTHCGAERKRTIQLQKGESLTATKLNGCVEIINSRSPATVDSYCGVCEICQDFIRGISR